MTSSTRAAAVVGDPSFATGALLTNSSAPMSEAFAPTTRGSPSRSVASSSGGRRAALVDHGRVGAQGRACRARRACRPACCVAPFMTISPLPGRRRRVGVRVGERARCWWPQHRRSAREAVRRRRAVHDRGVDVRGDVARAASPAARRRWRPRRRARCPRPTRRSSSGGRRSVEAAGVAGGRCRRCPPSSAPPTITVESTTSFLSPAEPTEVISTASDPTSVETTVERTSLFAVPALKATAGPRSPTR